MKLLLQRFKSKESLDSDMNIGLSLKSTQSEINTKDVSVIIDEYEQFSMERQLNFNYFLHGKFDFFRDNGYGFLPYFNDFEIPKISSANWMMTFVYPHTYEPDPTYRIALKNINIDTVTVNTSFELNLDDVIMGVGNNKEFYKILEINELNGDLILKLDRNISGKTYIMPSVAKYNRIYKEVNLEYKIYDCGLSVTIFNDPVKLFNITKDLNIETYFDEFNFPLTTGYFKVVNKHLTYNNQLNGNTVTGNVLDSVMFDLNEILVTKVDDIKSNFNFNGIDFWTKSFFPVEFKKFSTILEEGNTNTTTNIPHYSFNFGDLNSKWKDLLDIGFFQDGVGVDYPYMNNLHYLYTDIKLVFNRVLPIDLGIQSNVDDELLYNDSSSSILNNYC